MNKKILKTKEAFLLKRKCVNEKNYVNYILV